MSNAENETPRTGEGLRIPHDFVEIELIVGPVSTDVLSQCARCNMARIVYSGSDRPRFFRGGAQTDEGDCPRGDMTEERAALEAARIEEKYATGAAMAAHHPPPQPSPDGLSDRERLKTLLLDEMDGWGSRRDRRGKELTDASLANDISLLATLLADVRRDEREACALRCEDVILHSEPYRGDAGGGAAACARAIRARSSESSGEDHA